MTEKRDPEPQKKERGHDDLDLPEEVAEEVKGGTNVGQKMPNKHLPSKLK